MKRLTQTMTASLVVLSLNAIAAQVPALKMTTPIPDSITTPDKVKTSIGTLKYFDGVPSKDTVSTTYDYLDTARAVNVFLNSTPALSMNAIREGQTEYGCGDVGQICIVDNLMDSKGLFLTGNTSTMYAFGWIDLAKNGPTVVELPTGMLGVLDDMAFQYMSDLGLAGPDQGKGGKYLLLPPKYNGEVPKGYFVVESQTNGVWLFMRGYLDKGIKAASDNIRNNLKTYALSDASKPAQMEFVNISGENINTILPNDVSAFEKLHQLIQTEPNKFLGKEAKGMMASIGIEKGKPFAPDERMQKILKDAANIGNAAARSISFYPRDPGNLIYGDQSAWSMAYADKDTTFTTQEGAYRLDPRVFFHFGYIVVSPAMAVSTPGKGSDYAMAMIDSDKQALDGSNTYKLNVPANVPVEDFWAITMYDTQTRSQLQTDQQFPTLGSQAKDLQQNSDGSYDIYFAPKAPDGKEGNWLQTIPGKGWWIVFRVYGPKQAWIEKTWRLDEIELVN